MKQEEKEAQVRIVLKKVKLRWVKHGWNTGENMAPLTEGKICWVHWGHAEFRPELLMNTLQ